MFAVRLGADQFASHSQCVWSLMDKPETSYSASWCAVDTFFFCVPKWLLFNTISVSKYPELVGWSSSPICFRGSGASCEDPQPSAVGCQLHRRREAIRAVCTARNHVWHVHADSDALGEAAPSCAAHAATPKGRTGPHEPACTGRAGGTDGQRLGQTRKSVSCTIDGLGKRLLNCRVAKQTVVALSSGWSEFLRYRERCCFGHPDTPTAASAECTFASRHPGR